ncbi:hypothetical protein BDZ88DRAFT_425867 [Geranomyces variabilis]|nr:hypothetical protein BDZ88DRAFT_425867 [Geranomyces variabilis]KAJ3140692.1 hypothetical protein HDU90_007995 [Geranomyces variabilis]
MVSRTSPPMSSPAASSTSSSSSKSTSSSASHSSVSQSDAASPFYFGDPTYLPLRRRSVRLIERVARRFHLNFHDDHDHVPRDPETGRKIRSATSASSSTSTPQRASHHADTDDRSRRRPRSDSPPPHIKGRRKSSLGLLSPAPPLPSATSYEFPLTSSSPSSSSPQQQHNDPVDLLALIESYSRPESVIAYGTALPPPPRRQAGPRPTIRRRSAVVLPAFHRRLSYTLTSAPLETPMSDISVDPFDHVMVDEDTDDALDATGSNKQGDKGTLHLLDHATAVGFDTLLFGDNRKTIKVSLTPTFIASAAR